MDTPKQKNEIIDQLDRLEETIKIFREGNHLLEERLTVALTPVETTQVPKPGPKILSTSLGNALSTLNDELMCCLNRMRSIIERIILPVKLERDYCEGFTEKGEPSLDKLLDTMKLRKETNEITGTGPSQESNPKVTKLINELKAYLDKYGPL